MIRNSLKIITRNFLRKPAFSVINVFGLAIGIACFVLTMVYVNYELNYDNFHKHEDRIHLVTSTISYSNYSVENNTRTSAPLAAELYANFPEVTASVRTFGGMSFVFRHNENLFKERKLLFVDSTFFDVFSYDFIEGFPQNALNEVNNIVITESIAKKFFGNEKAYGKSLSTLNGNFSVTGVIKDPPKNSVISFDILISMSSINIQNASGSTIWQNNNYKTYIALQDGVHPKQLESKFPTLIKAKIPQIHGQDIESWLALGNRWEYHLCSLQNVYLDLEGNGIYVLGFALVALFLLIIACINYMNLSTAKASTRAKEVGVRLTIGATRRNLIRQFIGESMLMSFLSLIIGMGMVEAVLTVLSEFLGKELIIHYFDSFFVLPIIILLGITIGLLSGTYPAFVLSSYKPIKVLKGQKVTQLNKNTNLRSILVFIQFTISIFLLISLVVVNKQSNHLYEKNLGYDQENLLIIKNKGSKKTSLRTGKETFKVELLSMPGIENVTFTCTAPSKFGYPFKQWVSREGDSNLFAQMSVDPDYLETMKLQIFAGRFFNREFSTDSSAIVINETAANLLKSKEPLNIKLNNGSVECHIIGVVKDFNFQTLHREIEPLVMVYNGGIVNRIGSNDILVRFNPENLEATIANIKGLWGKYVPETPLEYYINSEKNKSYYKKEEQSSQLMLLLTLLVIFVTLIGLYGLASFTVEGRMKEIAIRKAMGASISDIIYKMTCNFTKLVLLANIIAWPLAWYFMNDWLNNFASRISLSWWIFVLAGLLSYLLAILTIIFQAYSAARKNPVDVLRYE